MAKRYEVTHYRDSLRFTDIYEFDTEAEAREHFNQLHGEAHLDDLEENATLCYKEEDKG